MPTSQGTILLIEDDDLIFGALKDRLERRHFFVSRAKDGVEGLKKCKQQNYKLVVTDLVLPKLNGFEIIRTLNFEYHKKIRFVVLSNLGNTSSYNDKDFFKSLGICRYLIKSEHSITALANEISKCANE